MEYLKNTINFMMIILLVFTLTSCKNNANSDNKSPIKDSIIEKFSEEKNINHDFIKEEDIKENGKVYKTTTNGKSSYIKEPQTIDTALSITYPNSDESFDIKTFMIEKYGEKAIYISIDGGETWSREVLNGDKSEEGLIGRSYSKESLEEYIKLTDSIEKEESIEEINGIKAIKYNGKILNENIDEFFALSGVANMLNAYYVVNENEIEKIYRDLGEINISLWLEEETGRLIKYEVEMQEIVSEVMRKAVELQGESPEHAIEYEKYSITFIITGYDTIDELVMPEGIEKG